jgi:hypothetical protein
MVSHKICESSGKEDPFYLQVLQMMAVARKIHSLSKKSQQGNPGR